MVGRHVSNTENALTILSGLAVRNSIHPGVVPFTFTHTLQNFNCHRLDLAHARQLPSIHQGVGSESSVADPTRSSPTPLKTSIVDARVWPTLDNSRPSKKGPDPSTPPAEPTRTEQGPLLFLAPCFRRCMTELRLAELLSEQRHGQPWTKKT